MALSIFGAGLGRTGTLSLKLALERLGCGPCYHMREVFDHLDTHVPLWDRAADGDNSVWDALFEGYHSGVDFPVGSFYRELSVHYPTAKVILTTRSSDRWYESFSQTIVRPLAEPLPDKLAEWGKMIHKTVTARVFDGNVGDREHVIASYERHNQNVKDTIPPERLLVYDVSQGWAPLCEFLGLSVPDEPFPKVNTTDEFRQLRAPLFKRNAPSLTQQK